MSRLKKPLAILLVCMVLVAIFAAGCKQKEASANTDPTQTATPTSSGQTDPEETSPEDTAPEESTSDVIPGEELIPEETEGILIEANYFTFSYPPQWDEEIEMVHTEEEQNQVITFRTTVADREIDLFSIVLGPNEAEGYLLGTFETEENGTINVYSQVKDQAEEGFTEAQYNEICALQERVNEITIQIQEDPRFVPNRP